MVTFLIKSNTSGFITQKLIRYFDKKNDTNIKKNLQIGK